MRLSRLIAIVNNHMVNDGMCEIFLLEGKSKIYNALRANVIREISIRDIVKCVRDGILYGEINAQKWRNVIKIKRNQTCRAIAGTYVDSGAISAPWPA